jgi:hypothetical protein
MGSMNNPWVLSLRPLGIDASIVALPVQINVEVKNIALWDAGTMLYGWSGCHWRETKRWACGVNAESVAAASGLAPATTLSSILRLSERL